MPLFLSDLKQLASEVGLSEGDLFTSPNTAYDNPFSLNLVEILNKLGVQGFAAAASAQMAENPNFAFRQLLDLSELSFN